MFQPLLKPARYLVQQRRDAHPPADLAGLLPGPLWMYVLQYLDDEKVGAPDCGLVLCLEVGLVVAPALLSWIQDVRRAMWAIKIASDNLNHVVNVAYVLE